MYAPVAEGGSLQKIMVGPKCMQDGSTAVAEKLEEKELVSILEEFKDVFAWSYEKMPGLDPNLVCHTLNI